MKKQILESSGKARQTEKSAVFLRAGRSLLAILIIFIIMVLASCGNGSSNPLLPGPAINIIITDTDEWDAAVNTVRTGGNGKTYHFDIQGTVNVSGYSSPTFEDVTGLTVHLKGTGTVALSSNGALLDLGPSQTVYIGVTGDSGNSPTLKGKNANNRVAVNISAGARVYLNNGAITGNRRDGISGGVGVNVASGAVFVMNGGTVSNNEFTGAANNGSGVFVNGTFTMTGGTIKANTAVTNGGGVFVAGGVFTKTRGTIYGNGEGGNSNSVSGNGHAVYVVSSGKYRNTTAGDEVPINSSDNTGLPLP
ncbi:MAG: hypothetical protein LBD09_03760 [Treponema sp.]|jgi:hypothetical protein|nr:hypothetical protein [Treponema sp.]